MSRNRAIRQDGMGNVFYSSKVCERKPPLVLEVQKGSFFEHVEEQKHHMDLLASRRLETRSHHWKLER